MGTMSVVSVVNNHINNPRVGLFVYSFLPEGFESPPLKWFLTFYEGYMIVLFWYGGGGGFDILYGGLSISFSKILEAAMPHPTEFYSVGRLRLIIRNYQGMEIMKTQVNECFASLLCYQKLIVMVVLCYLADNQIRNGSRIPLDEGMIFWGNFLFVCMRVRTWRTFSYASSTSEGFLESWLAKIRGIRLGTSQRLEMIKSLRMCRPIHFRVKNFYNLQSTTVFNFSLITADNIITVTKF